MEIVDKRSSMKLRYLYFILEIGVVYIHAFNLQIYGITGETGNARMFWLFETFCNDVFKGICVPFFFFISGYLYYRNYSWHSVLVKYKSRVKTLLMPYLLWNTLYFIAYYALTHIPAIASRMNMETLELSIPSYMAQMWKPIDSPLWFVRDLLFFVLLSPLYFCFLSLNRSKPWLSCLSGCFLVCFALFYEMEIFAFRFPFPFVNTYFLAGGYMSIYGRRFMESAKKEKTMAGIALICLCLMFGLKIKDYPLHVVWTLIMIIGIWFAMDIFSYSRLPKWWIGQAFFIYCAHSLLLEGLEKLWLLIGGRTLLAAMLDYILMPVITVIILLSIAFILEKNYGTIYFVLTGRRGMRDGITKKYLMQD